MIAVLALTPVTFVEVAKLVKLGPNSRRRRSGLFQKAGPTMKVLVGYDGSDSARDAYHGLTRAGLPRADGIPRGLGRRRVAPIAAVRVRAGRRAPGFKQSPIVRRAHALADAVRLEARALAEEGAAPLAHGVPGITCRPRELRGFALPCPDRADRRRAGPGGRRIGRPVGPAFPAGSVSENVLSHAPCSVRISCR